MSDLATRTESGTESGAPAAPVPHPPSVVVVGAVQALAVVVFGLVAVSLVVLVAWSADGRAGSSAGAALSTGVQAWLLAHHVGLALPVGHLGLPPLGLTALPALLLFRGGGVLARVVGVTTRRQAGAATAALAIPYAIVTMLLAGLAATDAVRPAVWQALAAGGVLAALAGGMGVLRTAGQAPVVGARLSAGVRSVLRAGGIALGTLTATGAAMAAVSIGLHLDRISGLAGALEPGLVGGLALFTLQLVYVPTVAAWGLAFVAGPGFALGAGTSVTPFGVTLGSVPALPLFGGLPDAVSALAPAVLLVPVSAGALAGLFVVRRNPTLAGRTAPVWGLAVGVMAAAGAALLALLAGGPIGGGRMATVGPSAWQVGLAVAAEVGLPAAAVIWWRTRPYPRWLARLSP